MNRFPQPVLQVRDPRNLSSRSELNELKKFLGTTQPQTDLNLVNEVTRKPVRKKSIFGIGRKEIDLMKPTGEIKSTSNVISDKLTTRRLVNGREIMYPLSPSSSASDFYVTPTSGKPTHPKRSFSYLESVPQAISLDSQLSSSAQGFRPSLLRGHSEQSTFNTTWNPLNTRESNSPPLTRVIKRKDELGTDLISLPPIATAQEANSKPMPPDDRTTVHAITIVGTTHDRSLSVSMSSQPNCSRLSQSSATQDHTSSVVQACLITREKVDASVQTDPIEVPQPLTSQHASFRARESFCPPTPPISSESLPNPLEKVCVCRPPSMHKTKRRKRRKTIAESTLHNTPLPILSSSNELSEITELEEMVNKDKAFGQLLAIYKHQKYLRDAEEGLNQQKVADLTASIISHKMENLRLLEMLHGKGISLQDIQEGATVAHELYLSPQEQPLDPSDMHSSELDISRFTMLRKVDQLGRMRQFRHPQDDLESPLSQSWKNEMIYNNDEIRDTRSERGCLNNSNMSNSPGPPDTSQPPIAGDSLCDPYSHADDIDQKMKSLEIAFISSQSRGSSLSTISINANPPTMVHDDSMNSRNTEADIHRSVSERDGISPNPNPLSGFLHNPSISFWSTPGTECQTKNILQNGLHNTGSTSHLRTRSESDIEHLLSRATDKSGNPYRETDSCAGDNYSPDTVKKSGDLGFVSFAMNNSWGSLLGELMHYSGGNLQQPVTQDFERGLGLHQG
ncbi:3572_t:CDS:2 [Acaulospora colombiana]|uniref:3572_t:CDS:1 n=1 Tax=Acaulospora colombiana TaxID=27376 RepID=A0ACA9L809_9GLOM|nr:3572_t:CDS:2 [Acaulospora colombiana]